MSRDLRAGSRTTEAPGRWAVLLDVHPPPRIFEVPGGARLVPDENQENGGDGQNTFDVVLLGQGIDPSREMLERIARAVVAGGGLVVTSPMDRDAIERAGFDDVRVYAALRDPARPKYLVPIEHRGAATHFFERIAPRGTRALDGVLLAIAGGFARAGWIGAIARGRHLLAAKRGAEGGVQDGSPGFLVDTWLRAEAAAVVGAERARTVHFVFITGWKADGSALTAIGFESGQRTPSFVAKVTTGSSTKESTTLVRNLGILAEGGAVPSVPRLLHVMQRPGATAVFESVVPGRPIRVPRGARALRALALRASHWLADFHRRTGTGPVTPDAETAERLLLEPFSRYRERFRPGREESAFLDGMREEARELSTWPLPLPYAHGDFCPPNLVEHEGVLGVLDWERPLEPTLPGHDLIHFLACLGERGRRAGYDAYEEAFFGRGALARIARDALLAHAIDLGVGADRLELLFTLFWLEYALEKEEVERTSGAAGSQPWGLARLERGTCVNVERLARSQGEFFLRMR